MAKPDKYIIYTAKELRAVATHKSDVIIEIDMPDAGLMPGVTVAVRMLSDEARAVAKLLLQAADDAEKQRGQQ